MGPVILIYKAVRLQELAVDQISHVLNIQHNNSAIKITMEILAYGYRLRQLNPA